MTILETVLVSFMAGFVVGLILILWAMFFRKGNLWEQGYDDGWDARGKALEERDFETREENKL